VRWQYRDGGLLWPIVAAYAIHIAEEWFGGFPLWMANVLGNPIPEAAFVWINAIALAVVIFGVLIATRADGVGWIAVAFATVFLINAAAHVVGSLVTASYSPGLISAVVLYVPLCSLVMIRAADHAPRGTVARGVVAGVLLHAVVFVAAYGASTNGWLGDETAIASSLPSS
jgi:hypothetical protein